MGSAISGLEAISGQTAIVVKCPVCSTSGEYLPINAMQTEGNITKYEARCFACSNNIVVELNLAYYGVPGKLNRTTTLIEAYSGAVCWK